MTKTIKTTNNDVRIYGNWAQIDGKRISWNFCKKKHSHLCEEGVNITDDLSVLDLANIVNSMFAGVDKSKYGVTSSCRFLIDNILYNYCWLIDGFPDSAINTEVPGCFKFGYAESVLGYEAIDDFYNKVNY